VEDLMENKQDTEKKTEGKVTNRHYTTSTRNRGTQSQTSKSPQTDSKSPQTERKSPQTDSKSPQTSKHPQTGRTPQTGSAGRDVKYKHNYANTSQHSRFNMDKVKTVETAEDIKNDISRIEKEIELEIQEIKSMRLGI